MGSHSSRFSRENEEINVYLKVPLKVKRCESIKNLKAMLHRRYGIPADTQHLLFNYETLADTQTLGECGIMNDSTLDLVIDSVRSMTIFVKLLSNQRTIMVESRIYDTIKDIKTMIYANEGLKPDGFTLIYEGKLVKDNSTLNSLKVQNGSTFYLVSTPKEKLSISVKQANGDTIKLQVEVVFTIRDVKAMVASMTDKDVKDWRLAFDGKQLEEYRTLAYYGIREGSMLDMFSPKIPIFVKTLCGKTITLDVYKADTVKAVKLKFHHKLIKMNMPTRTRPLTLAYAGKKLENFLTLSHYNIENDCTIHEIIE